MLDELKTMVDASQEERCQFVCDWAGQHCDEIYEIRKSLWIFVKDLPVDAIRRVVFAGKTDEQLQMEYREMRSGYKDKEGEYDERFDSVDQMIAWWEERAESMPVIVGRTHADSVNVWDGTCRLLHYCVTKSRETVPTMFGLLKRESEFFDADFVPSCVINGTQVSLVKKRYGNGRLAVQAVCEDEPYCTLTVNLPDEDLDKGQVFIKNWSENEGLLEQLESQLIVRRTGRVVRSGFTEVPVALLLV